MKITPFKKWRTEDGAEHSTREMAEHHIANAMLLDLMVRDDRTRDQAQDILNDLSSYRGQVRNWLDSCDAMEKVAFGP